MSGYYPGRDRAGGRSTDDRREPYRDRDRERDGDRRRGDIPWRDRERERDRERDSESYRGGGRYRSRSRPRPTGRYEDTRYDGRGRWSNEHSRDRASPPPRRRARSRSLSSGPSRNRSRSRSGDRRRWSGRNSVGRRSEERERDGRSYEKESRGVPTGPRSVKTIDRGYSARPDDKSVADNDDYSSEEGMVTPPPAISRPSLPPPANRGDYSRDRLPQTDGGRLPSGANSSDSRSARSPSRSDQKRIRGDDQRRDIPSGSTSATRTPDSQSPPPMKKPRLEEREPPNSGTMPSASPSTNPYALPRPMSFGIAPPRGPSAALGRGTKPFAPPSGPRSERMAGAAPRPQEPPRLPPVVRPIEVARSSRPASEDVVMTDAASPASVDTSTNRSIDNLAPRGPRIADPSPRETLYLSNSPQTPATVDLSPGTPPTRATPAPKASIDGRPVPLKGTPLANPYGAAGGDHRSSATTNSNPYASTPPNGRPSAAQHPPKSVRGWKPYPPPKEPLIIPREKLDNVQRVVEITKERSITITSREISKSLQWEEELAKSNYERAKKVHAFQAVAAAARLARYDLARAEDDLEAAQHKTAYARRYQAALMDQEEPSKWDLEVQ